jgi:cytoskeletal protein RodZ
MVTMLDEPKTSRRALPTVSLPRRPANAVPRSQAERLWLIGGGLAGFLLILIAYFLFIGPQRSHTSDAESRVAAQRAQNASLQTRIALLQHQKQNLPKYRAALQAAQRALPSSDQISTFVRSLESLGTATRTEVTGLTVGQPAPVTPTTGTPTAPAAAPSPAAPAAQPVVANVYSLAITLQVSGAPTGLDRFLQQLQASQPRAVLITQITESTTEATPGSGSAGGTTLQLAMQAFIQPPPGTPTAAATPH